jgi:hypothetical protein
VVVNAQRCNAAYKNLSITCSKIHIISNVVYSMAAVPGDFWGAGTQRMNVLADKCVEGGRTDANE